MKKFSNLTAGNQERSNSQTIEITNFSNGALGKNNKSFSGRNLRKRRNIRTEENINLAKNPQAFKASGLGTEEELFPRAQGHEFVMGALKRNGVSGISSLKGSSFKPLRDDNFVNQDRYPNNSEFPTLKRSFSALALLTDKKTDISSKHKIKPSLPALLKKDLATALDKRFCFMFAGFALLTIGAGISLVTPMVIPFINMFAWAGLSLHGLVSRLNVHKENNRYKDELSRAEKLRKLVQQEITSNDNEPFTADTINQSQKDSESAVQSTLQQYLERQKNELSIAQKRTYGIYVIRGIALIGYLGVLAAAIAVPIVGVSLTVAAAAGITLNAGWGIYGLSNWIENHLMRERLKPLKKINNDIEDYLEERGIQVSEEAEAEKETEAFLAPTVTPSPTSKSAPSSPTHPRIPLSHKLQHKKRDSTWQQEQEQVSMPPLSGIGY